MPRVCTTRSWLFYLMYYLVFFILIYPNNINNLIFNTYSISACDLPQALLNENSRRRHYDPDGWSLAPPLRCQASDMRNAWTRKSGEGSHYSSVVRLCCFCRTSPRSTKFQRFFVASLCLLLLSRYVFSPPAPRAALSPGSSIWQVLFFHQFAIWLFPGLSSSGRERSKAVCRVFSNLSPLDSSVIVRPVSLQTRCHWIYCHFHSSVGQTVIWKTSNVKVNKSYRGREHFAVLQLNWIGVS